MFKSIHWVYGIPRKGDAHSTLDQLFRQCGVPSVLIPDNAPEPTQGLFKKKALQAQCPIKPIEAYTPNANKAEMLIREIKRMLKRVMVETGSREV